MKYFWRSGWMIGVVVAGLVAWQAGGASAAGGGAAAGGATVNVSIKDMQYVPATVTVHVGDTVTWVNNDDRDHTVTSDDGVTFDSGNLKSGDSFSYTFTAAGSYSYSCSLRPRMRGKVVVE